MILVGVVMSADGLAGNFLRFLTYLVAWSEASVRSLQGMKLARMALGGESKQAELQSIRRCREVNVAELGPGPG